MTRDQRVSQLSSALSVGIGVAIAQVFTDWILKKGLPPWFPLISALVVVITTFQLLQFTFDTIFEMSAGVRKLLLGREFVEGTWLDLLSHDGVPFAYGITRIVSTGASLRITGEDYDLDASSTGFYRIDMLMFEFPKIKYKYTYQKSDNPGLAQEGFGEIQFMERNGPPKKYAGFSFNLKDDRRVTFESWKVENKDIFVQLENPESEQKAILEFFKFKMPAATP
jgi:hypothetical protein